MTDTITEILDRLERALRERNRTHDAYEIEYWVREIVTTIGDLYAAMEEISNGQT